MQRIIERLRDDLGRFVEQRDDLLLCLRASDDDAPVTLKLLRDLEQAQDADLFLLFGDDFVDPVSFVDAVVAQLREQRELASQALVEAGKAPLPALPASLGDARLTPPERLREMIAYARSLVPREGGHRVVWAMVPQRVSDRRAWLDMMGALVPHRGLEPWMRGVRVIFRDPCAPDDPAPDLSRAPRTRLARADFSAAAIERAIREDVEDPALPLESRMQALVTEASLDHAHGRTHDAIAKYRHALGHYQHTDNLTMQAMVMHGLGDVCRRAGMMDASIEWYECATEPAAACGAPVVLAVVVRSLGQLEYERGRYAEAEKYFEGLDTLAGRLLDPENKAYALEWKGASQRALGRVSDAVATWETGCTLCRNVGMPEPLRALVGRIQREGIAHG